MKFAQTYSSAEIIDLLQRDYEKAFMLIYEKYKNIIYSVALKLLKSRSLSEEIVQEVFLKLWTNRQKLIAVKNLDSYIFIITRNLVFDSLKKAAQDFVLQPEAMQTASLQEATTDFLIREKQMDEIIFNITQLLPPQQRVVFNLVKVDGLSYKKIAEKLDISPLTVKKHMALALKFIRQQLGNSLTVMILLLLAR